MRDKWQAIIKRSLLKLTLENRHVRLKVLFIMVSLSQAKVSLQHQLLRVQRLLIHLLPLTHTNAPLSLLCWRETRVTLSCSNGFESAASALKNFTPIELTPPPPAKVILPRVLLGVTQRIALVSLSILPIKMVTKTRNRRCRAAWNLHLISGFDLLLILLLLYEKPHRRLPAKN